MPPAACSRFHPTPEEYTRARAAGSVLANKPSSSTRRRQQIHLEDHRGEQGVAEDEGDKTMAAEQAQHCCATGSKRDAMPVAVAVSLSLCLLHDALGVALFLASHPLHTVYLLFFARGLLALAAFFWPLLVSTSLLLAVLATVCGGAGDWPGARSLGSRTCGIAVAALCAELRPDGAPAARAAGLVVQLCSFVLGATDAASVVRVEEIMGELVLDAITASCFVPEVEDSLLLVGGDDCKEPALFALPAMDYIGDRSFLDYESFCDLKDRIDEKVVISEDMKGSDPLAEEQCCFPGDRDTSFVQEVEAEEGEESAIQGQDMILSDVDELVSDGVEEKRLECDPVSVEIKKSEAVQGLEIRKSQQIQSLEIAELEPLEPMEAKQQMEIKRFEPLHPVEINKCEPVQAVHISKKFEPAELPKIKECDTQIKKLQHTLEIKKSVPVESVEIKKNELVKPRSLIAQRIKLWEAQVVSGNAKPFVGDREENSVKFSLKNKSAAKYAKKCVQFEADPCAVKCGSDQQAPISAPTEECVDQQQEQEFKDVTEYLHSETETIERCSHDTKSEEITPAVVAQAEQELVEQVCNDVQPEPDLQELEYEIAQPEQELEEIMEEVYSDVTQSPAMWNETESPLKSTSIAGRVHSRSSSENLLSEGSPSRKDKEWKRTLACKLYEERMQLRLCRDRAVEGSDNMDMLWEAYEVGSGGSKGSRVGKRGGSKAKGSTGKVEDAVEEEEEEEEDDDDDGGEGSVRQLCCLQALKFSTRKMNFGGGRPSLSKISKVLKRMTALSRMGSRRKQSE